MSSNKEYWLKCNDMGVWNMEHEGDYDRGDTLLHITVDQDGNPHVKRINTQDSASQKFFVFKHAYNSDLSWWEPWHYQRVNPEPLEAETEDALIESLKEDGLYAVFTLAEDTPYFEVQVQTVTTKERQVIRR